MVSTLNFEREDFWEALEDYYSGFKEYLELLPSSHLTTFLREEQYKKHTNGYYTKIKNASYKINSEQNLKINKIADDLRCYNIGGEFIYNQLTIEVPRKALENVKLPNTKKRLMIEVPREALENVKLPNTKKRLMIEVPREGAPKKAKLPNAKKNIPTKDICEKFKKILTNCIFEGSYILELN
ncbi:hypothetical protein Taitung243_07660 [Helicobacter pylori]